MRSYRNLLVVFACVLALGLFAWAQGRKAGLWEITSNMTWQQSPLPPGVNMPAGAANPFARGPQTTQVCLTQEQMDKYGTVPPQTQRDCQVTNITKSTTGMTAQIVCSGRMNGKGDIAATWIDDTHSSSHVHFTGVMQMGPNPKTVEWTIESTSVFKGADCGSVKPITEK